jgi:transcriptional regulator with XRE-family HTH domain
LGARLRELREAVGLSGEQAAMVLDGSQAKISRLESGVTRPGVLDVTALLELYAVGAAERDELLKLATAGASRGRSWWRDYVDAFGVQVRQRAALESEASAILHCCPFVMPGMVQIPEYTRKVFERTGHDVSRENVELAVSYQAARKMYVLANLSRYRILTTPAALSWSPSEDFDQGAQLRSLSAEVSGDSCFELRVLTEYPMDGVLAPPDFSIFTFDDEAVPAAGYLELPTGFHALESSAEIAYYDKVFATLWDKALNHDDSIACVRSMAESR